MEYKNNDYELIYLIKEKDDEALDLMFKKYEPLIKKIASHYFYLFNNRVTMDEIIEEGRIGLYHALKTYDSNYEIIFYTYALSCIKNTILKLYRFYNTKMRINDTLELKEDLIIDYDEPLKLTLKEELVKLFINFKTTLKFEDANIFELKINNFSYKEISWLLEIKEKTIDNRMFKIRNKLKKYILEMNYII